ncbi:hypothetical protein Tco_0251374 [Tanacetum coccineum]
MAEVVEVVVVVKVVKEYQEFDQGVTECDQEGDFVTRKMVNLGKDNFGVELGLKFLDSAFSRDEEEDFLMGEGVVMSSSSLEMLTKICLGGMMISLIFLEGLEDEALVQAMKEIYEEDGNDKKNVEDEYLI